MPNVPTSMSGQGPSALQPQQQELLISQQNQMNQMQMGNVNQMQQGNPQLQQNIQQHQLQQLQKQKLQQQMHSNAMDTGSGQQINEQMFNNFSGMPGANQNQGMQETMQHQINPQSQEFKLAMLQQQR